MTCIIVIVFEINRPPVGTTENKSSTEGIKHHKLYGWAGRKTKEKQNKEREKERERGRD